jgi:penicillin-binding protein 1B
VRIALIAGLGCLVIAATVFGYFYSKYERIVDDRLAKGPMFASVSQIYAAPREVRNGQKLSASTIAADLRRAGYNSNTQLGTFQLNGDSIFIKPGPQSYHTTTAPPSHQRRVVSASGWSGAPSAPTNSRPQLITRSLRAAVAPSRMITYTDIPPRMVQAVVHRRPQLLRAQRHQLLRIVKCGVKISPAARKLADPPSPCSWRAGSSSPREPEAQTHQS